MIGEKFGRLTILDVYKEKRNGRNRTFVKCKCECGNITNTRKDGVINGHTKSCGCYKGDRGTHKMSHTRFYSIWQGVKARCQNENNPAFEKYGGRGIILCPRWQTFENFRDDMYEPYLEHVKKYGESNTTIERINNDARYAPWNCRWATWEEQALNKRTRADSTSGYQGVTWYKPREKWRAYIFIKGKQETLGYYTDLDLAVEARKQAEEKYFNKENYSINCNERVIIK